MIILAIETSCDETTAAVVENGTTILSNVVASSAEMHAKTGGIIPEQAAREQVKAIIPVVQESLALAMKQLGHKAIKHHGSIASSHHSFIDTIATTIGPGLIGSLLVGVETARTLSWTWNKPLVPINHLIGHVYANWLNHTIKRHSSIASSLHRSMASSHHSIPTLPAIALVVSGGHTDLVLLKNHGELKWIGGTRDDAAGEAFDKTARLLGLGYPGGPAIASAAAKLKIAVRGSSNYSPREAGKLKIKLPRPLLDKDNYDFSFSGLKTAVLREVDKFKKSHVQSQNPASHLSLPTSALAYETQESITDVLVDKTLKAVQNYGVNTLLVAGGVAANKRLHEKFQQRILDLNLDLDLHIPPPQLCTDNAAMIASAAYFNYKPTEWEKVTVHPSLTITG
ncbi:MAG: tRNA (adenosine(37)-N6)-threonylcarbamoyltransferase complex transferase subunit TsaD [Candidatus Blackburnbacteria bacterium]|nr:tRNA (adenosine(37)-N6)-threonylcarbamoyltransferase complex transferase subunit TsaD [Candidatus Blackburnbacteria bacterium]